ncbi:Rubredoxin-NAD(+) reductase [Candidatus Burkholderia humilis]|nr:Rubredoxin-NAD(+) reductase [Candidatus Burkholderia humilis]
MKKAPRELVTFDADAMRAQLKAHIVTHSTVEHIDTEAHGLIVNETPLRYSKLVLALGADARRIPLTGDAADDVLSVNCLYDYARFRKRLHGAKTVALLGAGLIGCEFANDLALAGYNVMLIDPASTPLSRLLPQQAGNALAQALEQHGIRMMLDTTVQAVNKAQHG